MIWRRRRREGRSHPRAGSLRFRLTAIATVVVTVVLVLTGVALVTMQRRQLTANLDASLEQRADAIADGFATDVSPPPVSTNDEDRAVQLVAVDGTVITATANLNGEPALASPFAETATEQRTSEGDEVIETRDDLPLDDDSYRVLSRRLQTADGPAVLHVAQNSDDLEEAIRNLTIALAVTIPAVAAILAVLTWWLTGRALKPVDRMRAQVDSISATNSDQRIHIPERDDEISRLGVTMNRMLDRLTDATEQQRRFVADAAHELRTPLTRIRTNVDVDFAQPETADPVATLRAVRQEAIDLQELVDDLLHLARSDAGQTPRHREPVDLDDIVMQEIRDLRSTNPIPTIDAANVSAAHLWASPEHLRRAFRNVLTNAARHAETSITVALAEDDAFVELAVANDGPGIPTEHQARIFERFTRVQDARTRDDGGTGLGLAIAREIVHDHGGTIAYDPDYDGARFVIRLPAAGDSPSVEIL